MSYFSKMDNMGLEKLTSLFLSDPKVFLCETEEQELYTEELAHYISKKGKKGIDFLIMFISDSVVLKNHDKLRSIIFSFGNCRGNEVIQDILESYLNDSRPYILSETIDSLGKLGASKLEDKIYGYLNHESYLVRASTIRYFSCINSDKLNSILLKSMHDPSDVVRENVVDIIDDENIFSIISFLPPLLKDPNSNIRAIVESIIQRS